MHWPSLEVFDSSSQHQHISTCGTNSASLPAEPLHLTPPNATKNSDLMYTARDLLKA